MARLSNDVLRIVCANTSQENEKRLHEARIKNQGKNRAKQDLNKFFSKLNQTVETNSGKASDKSSPSCYNKNVTNCWYGPILRFPPGSWWGIRMDCSRDRVHDPFDVDIHEGPFGVVSVCTSHTNMNEDVDFGDYLTLTGKIYCEDQSSVDPFIHNYKNQIPLRLIRSYNLQNEIAPNTGYRYDGLYVIIACWIGEALDGTKYNKFALMRLADQEPPSWNSKTSEDSSARRVPLNKLNCPNTYDLRKSSYTSGICEKRKLSHSDNREDMSVVKSVLPIDVSRKSVPESSIVTRHVFKKTPNNVECTTSTSVSDRKTLTCLGASTTKTHSTNISIRMGLYESSHNTQDAKKNVSTMLHKPSKPIDIAVRSALDIEGVRSTPKEDSKPVGKIDTDRARINSWPGENVSYNGYIATDNTNEITCPLSKRRRNVYSQVALSSEHSHSVSSSLNGLDNDTDIIEHEEQLQNTEQSLNAQKLNLNGEPEVQKLNAEEHHETKNSIVTQGKITQSQDASEISSEPFCAQNIKSLDSLTPDKILNLINKEKHHPLSKLLIGNVIGLTTEEYAMMNATQATTPDSKNETPTSPKVNLKKRRKGEDNVKENVACLDNRRHCRYSKSKSISWKVKKQLDAGKLDKVLPDRQSCNDADDKCNNNARKNNRSGVSSENTEYLSPLRVQTSLQAIVQHTRSSYDIKTRLRSDRSAVLAKQEFSNSSIKKNRYKKQDREVANLSIDANFGPVTRGPRNRRLRCRNSAFTNKRYYNTFNAVLYSPSKRCKSSFQRKSKLTKVTRQRARDRQAKERYKVSSTLHANSKDIKNSMQKSKNLQSTASNNKSEDCNYNNNNSNNRKKEIVKVDDRNISKTSFDRCLRKKLAQTTVTLSQRAAQTSHINLHKKQAEKPNTTDAMTQCRLITENPEVYVIGQLDDQRAILKMEWDKLAKLKSESICGVVLDDRGSEIYQTVRLCPVAAFAEDKAAEFADSLQDTTSAFVPVNAFDSDLRIARLRSIGFKPILKPGSSQAAHDPEILQNTLVATSKVTKRDVAEEYDKYTNNEDNNMVVYLDDELQYQDIEEEDDESTLAANTSKKSKLKGMQSKVGSVFSETLPTRENLESPWHGWKKIVTNNRSYWIGW
ncbi:uncharacterized protein [Linepithema humile]|uniref:uncharacterized protein n=1 Tax=Linepithema humile TaxID=83485 RepID=UPI0006232064|nr:PREDICTED: uncharacterized protein LOC105670321 [Linepithema humile]